MKKLVLLIKDITIAFAIGCGWICYCGRVMLLYCYF